MNNNIHDFALAILDANNITYFTGAGVSTDAGIPDFRSDKGLYNVLAKKYKGHPDRMLSHQVYVQDPASFFQFQWKYMYHPDVEPAFPHKFPVKLQELGKNVPVITQNADGLHERAGSRRVYALHGSQYDFYCTKCGTPYSYEDLVLDEDQVPRCPKDGHIVRSTAVLFGESLDYQVLTGAIDAISQADLLIVAGTSLTVSPANQLVHYFSGKRLVVINNQSLAQVSPNQMTFQEEITPVLEGVWEEICQELGLED